MECELCGGKVELLALMGEDMYWCEKCQALMDTTAIYIRFNRADTGMIKRAIVAARAYRSRGGK